LFAGCLSSNIGVATGEAKGEAGKLKRAGAARFRRRSLRARAWHLFHQSDASLTFPSKPQTVKPENQK